MAYRLTKPKWLSQIKVLVWDFDGTLYKELPEIKSEIHKNVIELVVKARGLSWQKAEKLFWKNYHTLGSSIKSLIALGVDREYVLAGEWYSKIQLKYLKKDERLAEMFKGLEGLRHIIDTNGAGPPTIKKLKKLGLSLEIFEKIFTNAEMFGRFKPDLFPFRAILDYTALKPEKHLFIGDREKTDLVPAKKIGMRTCLVWGKSKLADISLRKVYDVEKLFC